MTYAELLKELGTTNTAARFADYYGIPQWVADFMFDYAWVLNGKRTKVNTHGISSWVRGGFGRAESAIAMQSAATSLVKEMIDAARAPE